MDAKARDAWKEFEANLAPILAALENEQFLILSSRSKWAYVQFAGGANDLHAESVSNHYLPGEHALDAARLLALESLGWHPPARRPDEDKAKGSPNFFRQFTSPVPGAEVAGLTVRTLGDVMGVPGPDDLEYEAFDKSSRVILLPTLGVAHRTKLPKAKPSEETVQQIRDRVLGTLRKVWNSADLVFDENGFLPLRFGSALIVLQVNAKPLSVTVAAPLARNVREDEMLLARLNDLNARVQHPRFFVRHGVITAALDVSAAPFVADHVVGACLRIGFIADELDDVLQRQFGGRTSLGEFWPRGPVH